MAVSAIAPGTLPQTNPFAQTRQALSQLSSALQSGNLSVAQNAYNTLSSSPLAQNGPFAQAIQQIGQDLQSGDIAGAQKALASLQEQAAAQQQAHGHHGHHHGGGESEGVKDSSSTTSTSSTSSTTSTRDADGDGYDDVTGAPINPTAASSSSNHAVDVKV